MLYLRQSHYRKNVNILGLIETLATMRVSQTFSIIRHPSDFNVAYRFFFKLMLEEAEVYRVILPCKEILAVYSMYGTVRKYLSCIFFLLCSLPHKQPMKTFLFNRYLWTEGKVKYNQIFATFTWKIMIRFFDIISCLKTQYSNKKAKET